MSHNWYCATDSDTTYRSMVSGTSNGWNYQIFRDDSNASSDYMTASYYTGFPGCSVGAGLGTMKTYDGTNYDIGYYCHTWDLNQLSKNGYFQGFVDIGRMTAQVTAIDGNGAFEYFADVESTSWRAEEPIVPIAVSGITWHSQYTHGDYPTETRQVGAYVQLTGRVQKVAW